MESDIGAVSRCYSWRQWQRCVSEHALLPSPLPRERAMDIVHGQLLRVRSRKLRRAHDDLELGQRTMHAQPAVLDALVVAALIGTARCAAACRRPPARSTTWPACSPRRRRRTRHVVLDAGHIQNSMVEPLSGPALGQQLLVHRAQAAQLLAVDWATLLPIAAQVQWHAQYPLRFRPIVRQQPAQPASLRVDGAPSLHRDVVVGNDATSKEDGRHRAAPRRHRPAGGAARMTAAAAAGRRSRP